MFGWEFPPFNSGGLGTACLGLTKGLSSLGVDVTFVIPKAPKGLAAQHSHVNITVASRVKPTQETINKSLPHIHFEEVRTLLTPYMTESEYLAKYKASLKEEMLRRGITETEDHGTDTTVYGKDLYSEVIRYSNKAALIASQKEFDVIHAHDWMTYKAGIVAKAVSNKPLVLHIHATEFDRTGGNCNQTVYDIEREGFHAADKILAVSNLTRDTVIQKYGVPPDKVSVVHNAVEFSNKHIECSSKLSQTDKIVLFLGRITLQKGPEYFVQAAAKVLTKLPNTTFVVAGNGDMEHRMIDLAADLGIGKKMIFTGFLRGDDIDRAYKMADLYVMPSVSEPFGITPLESMRNGTPVLISRTSGVSEVVTHALKVDFWDIHQMASKMISVLKYAPLHECLRDNGSKEVCKFDWKNPAQLCVQAYHEVRGSKQW